MSRFEEMEFSASLKKALAEMKYIDATEVQSRVIPLMLNGSNVIAKSYTGSGKTAAFAIPISDRILQGRSRSVLIIGPTRELVVQVKDEVRAINKYTRMRVIAVYGGHGIEGEMNLLQRGVDVLCATPGRLLDHIERGTVKPSQFDTVILDEADRMLDMGFIDDIKKVLNVVRPRNTHLFSATLDGKVADLIREHIPHYEEVIVKHEIVGTNIIEKKFIVPRDQKFGQLIKYVTDAGKDRVLVFVSTKRWAEMLRERLERRGFRAAAIHGDLSQKMRELSLANFKSGRKNILIATDVAARGLQIDNVEYVINYDEAVDAETHTHRIGRTGRMGATGYAITFMDDGTSPTRGYDPYRSSGNARRPQEGRNSRYWKDRRARPTGNGKVREFTSIQEHIERGY